MASWRSIDPLRKYFLVVIFVALFLTFSLMTTAFLTINNLIMLTKQAGVLIVLALGVGFTLFAGEIDLTFAGSLGLISVFTAFFLLSYGSLWFLAPLLAIGIGIGIGVFNGVVTTKVGVPSLLVTLGMMMVTKGIAYGMTGYDNPPLISLRISEIFGGEIFGIPNITLWWLLIAAVAYYLLAKSPFGRRVLATGGDKTSAEWKGVNTDRIIILTFILSGIMAAFGAVLNLARAGIAKATAGEPFLMTAIAAPVLGGASLSGGEGSISGTILGALVLSIISNGMNVIGAEPYTKMVVRGVVLVIALALSSKSSS